MSRSWPEAPAPRIACTSSSAGTAPRPSPSWHAVLVAGAAVVVLSLWNRDRLQLAEAEGFRHQGILSQAREQYARADREAALETIKPILQSQHVGPEAQLLHAGILVDNRRSDEAVTILNDSAQ